VTTGSEADAAWPGPLYLDASALAKLLLPETGSTALNRSLVGRRDLLLSDLAITETVSALRRRTREGVIGIEDVVGIQRAMLDLFESGSVLRVELDGPTHREAERLLVHLEAPLRAADALHLAMALGAEAAGVVTFDQRLRAAAAATGLHVLPSHA
jgi:predicted nucleic acid-binding protein